MTFYRFAGLVIVSDFAVAGLRPIDANAAVGEDTLTLGACSGPAPVADRITFAWPGRYATRLGTIGDDWLIDSGFDGVFRIDRALRHMQVYSAQTPPSAAAIDVLVRRILPRLLAARGALTIHAAAVATQAGGVLLLGASGAGKSTTTAALATMPGWHVFSDDLSVLWESAPTIVAPSATGVCVWRESQAGLGIDPAACHAMPGYDGKVRFEPPVAATTAPVPLRAMVFLSRDADRADVAVTPVNRAEALVHAARQLILFDPSAPAATEHAAAIAGLNRIAASVPAVRLSYPSRFDALPAVAAALAELTHA